MFVDVLSGPKTWKSCRVLHVSPDGKLCIVRYTDSPNVVRNVDIKDRIRATPETLTLYNATRLDDASMAPGSPVTGVITNLKPYAAFVDISSEKEAVLGFTEANLSDLRVGQGVECEIATKRGGRWQLAPKGTFGLEEVALHRFHTQGPKAGWLAGRVVGAERYCLYVNVEAPGLSHTVWGEVYADQIRDGYVGDARLEYKVGDAVRDFSSSWKVCLDEARRVARLEGETWYDSTAQVVTSGGFLVLANLLEEPVPAFLPGAWVPRRLRQSLREGSKVSVRVADVDVGGGRIVVTSMPIENGVPFEDGGV
ncbi:FTSH10 [Symbiodinium sp. CCMP2592]|nr:FTSH10 [Symbiodinium sp. CCMP2592]